MLVEEAFTGTKPGAGEDGDSNEQEVEHSVHVHLMGTRTIKMKLEDTRIHLPWNTTTPSRDVCVSLSSNGPPSIACLLHVRK